MVGRSVDKKDEIRAYIKARSKFGCSLKKLMTEISTAFEPSCVSYNTVWRWKKKFESGVESIKNAPKSGRPKSASRKEIVSKIKEIIEGDARFTVRDIVRKVGISLSTVHVILKKHLKVRKISARWVPHLLYAIFFSGEGVAIKVPVKKGKSITGKYYKDVVLKKLKKYYQKRRPATGFKHVRLLHDNASAHTSAIVTAFLKKEKVTVLPPRFHPALPPPPPPRIP